MVSWDSQTPRTAQVVRLFGAQTDRECLVAGLQQGDTWAASEFCRQFGPLMNRLVWHLLGADVEHDDVVHQVYVNVLSSIHTLCEPHGLEEWVSQITINTVRREMRSRRFRRIARFVSRASATPGGAAPLFQVQRLFDVLDTMRPNERIVFVLRFVEAFTLVEIAARTGLSLKSSKRALRRAKYAFLKRSRRDPILASWLEELEHG